MRTLIKLAVLVLIAAAVAWGVGRWLERSPVGRVADERREDAVVLFGDEPAPAPGRAGTEAMPRGEPGTPLVVELIEPPAAAYGTRPPSEQERWYAEIAARVGGASYDAALGQAARELAAFHALEGRLAPGPVLSFLLDSAGAAEWGVEQVVVTTSADGVEAVETHLRRILEGRPRSSRVGIGETWTLGRPARRHIAVLISRGSLTLDAVPRTARAGRRVTVAGSLPAEARALSVLVMGPDLVVADHPVTRRGRRFLADIPAGTERGILWVELIEKGPTGPRPLAQLALHVDEPAATVLETRWPPDESELADATDAEALALALLNDDRRASGLAPLAREEALDQVARGHSHDMRDGRFFGHVSPTTGDVSARLQAAGVRTVMHAENVARNDTLHDAQDGLMHSIGHRRNILGDKATGVGIGVAEDRSQGRRQWLLTQVFARPRPRIEASSAVEEVLDALQAARREGGVPPLRVDGGLGRAADEEARAASASPRGVLDRAEGVLPRGGWASVARVHELPGLEIPGDVLEPRYRRVGVGIHQHPDVDGPDIVVVVLVGG